MNRAVKLEVLVPNMQSALLAATIQALVPGVKDIVVESSRLTYEENL